MRSYTEFPGFLCVDHPLIQHKLSQLRDVQCGMTGFRSMLREISLLIGYEISRDLALVTRRIQTPLAEMDAPVLAEPAPCVVPILRAGLGMAEGLMALIPTAQMGHIGLYRDHDTKKPVEYLVRLPRNIGQDFFVVDPMLATGHSLVYACDLLIKHGVNPQKIRVMALVAAPEGVKHFHNFHPGVRVYCASLDEKLNGNAYIVPGLGDAGDRMYGTDN